MMKGTEAPAKSCNHAHMPCRTFRFSVIRALVRSRDVESLFRKMTLPLARGPAIRFPTSVSCHHNKMQALVDA